MNLLVINAGSSSLKFKLFRMDSLIPLSDSQTVLAHGQVDRVGSPGAELTIAFGGGEPSHRHTVSADSVADAAREVIQRITSPSQPGAAPAIHAVGHRIVHGGPRFFQPHRVDEALLDDIRSLVDLAPLHNPAGIAGVEAARSALPGVPNVTVFDTAFHHRLPPVSATYALPSDLSERLKLRRYGFHGISYRYVSERVALCSKPPRMPARLIICHLGNGASVCALRDGRSVDTSMGFTPVEGLVMGTRCGDTDPGLLLHLLEAGLMSAEELSDTINHKSGLLGLSGLSGDVRDLEKASAAGHRGAELALNCFAYRVRKYVGAYAAALGGIDTLVFTGGIGEHSHSMRARICSGLDFVGLSIDEPCNLAAAGDQPARIGGSDGREIWVVPTDEERQIAREAFALLERPPAAAD